MGIKIVVVGSNSIVKRTLLMNFKEQKTERDYLPTGVSTFSHEDDGCDATMWDTSGFEGLPRLRQLNYPETNVFLLTYSTTDADSFNAVSQYYSEISSACPRAAIILAAVDMQKLDEIDLIAEEEGRDLAKRMGVPFQQCNINNLNDVNLVFKLTMKQDVELGKRKKIQQHMRLWGGGLSAPSAEKTNGQQQSLHRGL